MKGPLTKLYGENHDLALLMDAYMISMAQIYWHNGIHKREAVFQYFFRRLPFKGGYALFAGLEPLLEWVLSFRFKREHLGYLATHTGYDGNPKYSCGFLEYLDGLKLDIELYAAPEGTVVFPYMPIVRARGELLKVQLLETALLTLCNFPSLIATKASRIKLQSRGEQLFEFGMRRAQGIDGAFTATRSAYIGGFDGTSNLLAGYHLGIPVSGTMGHSLVMAFDTQLDAFLGASKAMPNSVVFLVDTKSTIEGVKDAIRAGRWLRDRGYTFIGVRLDSGDLCQLSKTARRMLDRAGFHDAVVIAENELDEHLIAQHRRNGSRIAIWGVGTKLVTAYDSPAHDGVYKMTAVRQSGVPGSAWRYPIKLSDTDAKITTPTIQNVRRFKHKGKFFADMAFDSENPPQGENVIVDPNSSARLWTAPKRAQSADLLVAVLDRERGQVYSCPHLSEVKGYAAEQLALLPDGVKALDNPDAYPVGLERGLFTRKQRWIAQARAS